MYKSNIYRELRQRHYKNVIKKFSLFALVAVTGWSMYLFQLLLATHYYIKKI